MIAKNILKRLIFSLLICIGASVIYWVASEETLSNEGKQYYFVLLILDLGVCIFSGLLSLTALLNTKPSVASNETYSLLSFITLPLLLFIALLIMFCVNRNSSETLLDFLQPGLPSVFHCIILIIQFFSFRSWYEKHIKQT